MKKQFFAAAMILALGAGFTACSNDDLGKQEAKAVSQTGTSYMSISFTLPAPAGTRASNSVAAAGTPATGSGRYQYGSWNGDDKIKSVKVFVFKTENGASTLEKVQTYNEGDLAFTQNTTGTVKVIANDAFKISKGEKTVYVIVNPTGVVNFTETEGTSLATFKAQYEGSTLNFTDPSPAPTAIAATVKTRADQVASVENNKDVITMTGEPTNLTVEDGVTRQQAISGAKNLASFSVKRVAARVVVTTATGNTTFNITGDDPSTEIKENKFIFATVSNLTYTVGQGEKTFYFKVKNHTDTEKGHTQDNEGNQIYEESPAFTFTTPKSEDYWSATNMAAYTKALEKYDYLGLWKTANNVQQRSAFLGGAAQDDAETALVNGHITATTGGDRGIFVLPTTHKYDASKDATGYLGTNTAYVLIRGTYTPKIYVDDNGDFKKDNALAGNDFYVGTNGLVYKSAATVTDPTKKGVAGQKAQLFKGGKVLYFVWIHPDKLADPVNSPVDRNNVYHIQIASVTRIGANWNPLVPYPGGTTPPNFGDPNTPPVYPTNPNNPDDRPNNPLEPKNPPVNPFDNLTPKETWMSVNVTILPWAVHSYQVNL